jgi:hypothetical protein
MTPKIADNDPEPSAEPPQKHHQISWTIQTSPEVAGFCRQEVAEPDSVQNDH